MDLVSLRYSASGAKLPKAFAPVRNFFIGARLSGFNILTKTVGCTSFWHFIDEAISLMIATCTCSTTLSSSLVYRDKHPTTLCDDWTMELLRRRFCPTETVLWPQKLEESTDSAQTCPITAILAYQEAIYIFSSSDNPLPLHS